ncbi:GIY-YIG nuclease family protein [Candidatus Saccharibacteria bacterium]|nr:GIY-YIG nuclease family protein [Candidatus Saccharibacteria bacterium]
MTITTKTTLGSHVFTGPHTSNGTLPVASGVYIITTLAQNSRNTIIDIGESESIKDRISNHDRTAQWRQNAINGLYVWVFLANESQRMLVERAHRIAYRPVCGDR